jgi:hypothetical protein
MPAGVIVAMTIAPGDYKFRIGRLLARAGRALTKAFSRLRIPAKPPESQSSPPHTLSGHSPTAGSAALKGSRIWYDLTDSLIYPASLGAVVYSFIDACVEGKFCRGFGG